MARNHRWNTIVTCAAGEVIVREFVQGIVGASAYPVARNFAKPNVLSHLWSGAFEDAPLTRAADEAPLTRRR